MTRPLPGQKVRQWCAATATSCAKPCSSGLMPRPGSHCKSCWLNSPHCHQQQPPRRPIPDNLCQRKPELRLEADPRLHRVRGGLDQPEAAERTPASGLFSSRCRFVVPVCPGNFSELTRPSFGSNIVGTGGTSGKASEPVLNDVSSCPRK